MKKIIEKILLKLSALGLFNWMKDETYLRMCYRIFMGEKLNLYQPKTFNEKMQWLKINSRKPEYSNYVDKYKVREHVRNLIGEKYLIPIVGVYENFEEIKFEDLPSKFVLKCTHDSGSVIICKDKDKFDIKKYKKKVKKLLKRNYYYIGREWPYKNVKPRIIIEKYLQDDKSEELNDYKIFCFNGKAYMILVCSNRKKNDKNTDFFDINWNKMNLTREYHENSKHIIEKPRNLKKMIEIAELLSKDMYFMRVDLYEINGRIYFGELTFFPSSGFEGFNPKEWDIKLGNMIKLKDNYKEGYS